MAVADEPEAAKRLRRKVRPANDDEEDDDPEQAEENVMSWTPEMSKAIARLAAMGIVPEAVHERDGLYGKVTTFDMGGDAGLLLRFEGDAPPDLVKGAFAHEHEEFAVLSSPWSKGKHL